MSKFLRLAPYLAAIASGILLASCFPGFEFASGLVWVWPVPLMLALWLGGSEKKRKRFGFRVGALAGLAFWMINVKWLIAMGELPTVPVGGAIFGWLMLSLYLALYFGVWGALLAGIGNPWRKRNFREPSAIEKKIAERDEAPKKRATGFKTSLRVLIFAVMHASLWVVLEWLRGWVMTGFGWNGLGVAFHEVPVMMQVADIVGVTGIAFFPMLFASAMLQTGRRLIDEVRAGKFQAHFEIGIVVGVIAMIFAYGVNRMAYYSNQPNRVVNVLLIQENIEQRMKWDEIKEVTHYQSYLESTQHALTEIELSNERAMQQALEEQSGEALAIEYPDFVIYPESALTQPVIFVEGEAGFIPSMLTDDLLRRNLLVDQNFHVLFGSNLVEGKASGSGYMYLPEGRAYNAFCIASPEITNEQHFPSTTIQAKGKSHLVPFGEYIPNIPFLHSLMELTSGNSFGMNFSASESRDPLTVETRDGKLELIPSVCFEDTVGRLVRQFARPEQQMLVNITNDGWFGTSEAALQHMANSKFRAVEIRRPMARAANTGVSGVVDVIGSMGADEEGQFNMIGTPENPFVKGTLYAKVKVPQNPTMTIYAMFGDWFSLFCLLLCIGSMTFCLKSEKKL
ncbi:MAG: apolipoprotein N-acyltransferase [Crocinitomicaceae bacterium]|jgi:apolipoprotein N-acyltransferase